MVTSTDQMQMPNANVRTTTRIDQPGCATRTGQTAVLCKFTANIVSLRFTTPVRERLTGQAPIRCPGSNATSLRRLGHDHGVSHMLRRLITNRSGNVMMMTALCMPIMVGAAGLASDTVSWALTRRQLQREADSAALAGAFALTQGRDAGDAARHDITEASDVQLSAQPVIANAPTSGNYAGNVNAVRVTLASTPALPFSAMFMAAAPTLTATATAAALTNGTYCVTALNPGSNWGINLQGNAAVNLSCGMASNSTSSTGAISASGSSQVTASPLAAVGYIPASSNFAANTVISSYAVPQKDPFISLPTPVVPSGCNPILNSSPNSTVTVSNPTGVACYRGMNLKGTVTLDPGIYYIDGSSFTTGSQAVVTGYGVTIILTSSTASTSGSSVATLNLGAGSTLNLTATTSGTYGGILFYQDRRASGYVNGAGGNSSSTFQGAFYFPSEELDFNGTAGINTNCVQIVASTIQFIGNASITNVCPAGSGAAAFTGTVVRLVE